MSLSAVVYKKANELPGNLSGLVRLVDAESGEIEYSDPAVEALYTPDSLFAIYKRLGNAAMTAWIAEQLEQVAAGRGHALQLFLGSHSGSIFPVSGFPAIEGELAFLKLRTQALGPEILAFLRSVEELVSAARLRNNPIAFL